MKFLLLSILFFQLAYTYTESDLKAEMTFPSRAVYTDPELENLWSSVSDITNPTLADYKLIESYLKYGNRPYLKMLFDTSTLYYWPADYVNRRIEQIRDFKLVGPNGEMPIFELHQLQVTEKTKDRCILIYSSYNHPYPKKALQVLEELKECGYSGNVMIRIGGFPNLSEGGLKFSPFFQSLWKNEFFKEALRMGFTKIVHIDTSIHPLTDLTAVFETIDSKGYFLLWAGYEMGCMPCFHKHRHIDYLNFTQEERSHIPWIPCYIIGINFANEKATKLFYDWDRATKNIDEFYYSGGDENMMSLLAWKHHLPPVDFFSARVMESNHRPPMISNMADFYLDSWRK